MGETQSYSGSDVLPLGVSPSGLNLEKSTHMEGGLERGVNVVHIGTPAIHL